MKRSAYLLALLLICLAACKKSGGGAAKCRIASVSMVPTGGTPVIANFTYDTEGRLKFTTSGNQTVEQTYFTNAYKRRATSGNGWYTNSWIELNASGMPVSKKDSVYNGQSLSQSYITTFEYNSQGQLINVYKDNNPQPQETFTWANGNLVKYKAGNTAYILDYYTDKPNRDFSFIDLQLFAALGMNPARSKNLLKSLTNNNEQLIFQYEYDNKGNLKKWQGNLLGSADIAIVTTLLATCD